MSLPRYIIHQMIPIHCKRGPHSCEQCQKLHQEGEKYCVLQLFPGGSDPPVARPVLDFDWEGNFYMCEFEFVRCFDQLQDAEILLEERISQSK